MVIHSICLSSIRCRDVYTVLAFNTLRPRKNGRHFPNEIFMCIFINKNAWLSIVNLLKYSTTGDSPEIWFWARLNILRVKTLSLISYYAFIHLYALRIAYCFLHLAYASLSPGPYDGLSYMPNFNTYISVNIFSNLLDENKTTHFLLLVWYISYLYRCYSYARLLTTCLNGKLKIFVLLSKLWCTHQFSFLNVYRSWWNRIRRNAG